MELMDTHCHLDVAAFDPDRSQVLDRCRAAGVQRLLIPAVDASGWDHLLELCGHEPGLYPALGLHPVHLRRHDDHDLIALEQRLSADRPVAVGEIGLDYYVSDLDRQRQQRLFEAQLEIARSVGLPVILHVRKAHDQVLSTLRRIRVTGGIAHAFNGSLQQAGHYIDLGFKLGFGGMLTFQRSNKLRRLARALPLEALVLETDAPDLPPASHRGQRNSPEYLPECLAALAAVRDADPVEVAAQTTRNAVAVLAIDA